MRPETLRVEPVCPHCGATLPPGHTANACPRCLLQAALAGEPDPPDGGGPPETARLGNYELAGEIARGGMGVVYRARQAGLNRFVAVKVVAGGGFAAPEARERFRIEAESAARLAHPNIIAIHEVGEIDGRQFLSMELVDGPNLAKWKQGRTVSADEAAALVRTLAGAIHFAHQRGVLHRDLKPQNILMDADGVPRITDFGLARQAGDARELTVTGTGFGSPGYVAPEQALGRRDRLGPGSDIYALGAILYYLLTDQAPHAAATAMEAFRKALEEPPVPPGRLNPAVPRDLETICLKCLEKEPGRRYVTARALAEDLERFLRREPPQARRPGPFWRAWAIARARPWVITGLTSLILLAMIGLAYGLWQQTRFLQWRIDHPGLAPPFGMMFVFSPDAASLLVYACMLCGYLPLKDLRVRLAEGRVFERTDVLSYCAAGIAFGALGVGLLLTCMRSFVWQHAHAWGWNRLALLPSFGFFWFGSIIALKAIRGHYAGQISTDMLVAQRGSPIGVAPAHFLSAMLLPIAVIAPAAWFGLGPARAATFAYLLTNSFLLVLGLRFWQAMRDEMRPFWQFLVIALTALSAELAATLPGRPAVAALATGSVIGLAIIRRARIAGRT